eukprot:415630-Pyramimonas_sp.AAC.1
MNAASGGAAPPALAPDSPGPKAAAGGAGEVGNRTLYTDALPGPALTLAQEARTWCTWDPGVYRSVLNDSWFATCGLGQDKS